MSGAAPGSRSHRRLVRRAAVQAIFQLDASEEPDLDTIRESLDGGAGSDDDREEAFTTAVAAWADRGRADRLMKLVAPQWPPSRQAATDRAILRLACYEMLERGLAPGIVIDEAVELAREFSTGDSPRFVHGVLEGIRKQFEAEQGGPPAAGADASGTDPDGPAATPSPDPSPTAND
jgi:N utilization substance protein B